MPALRMGNLPTPVEIWSSLVINKLSPDTSYEQAKRVLEEAQFDKVYELHTFLAYNLSSGKYGTSIWTPKNVEWKNLSADRKRSLDALEVIAKDFLHEQRNQSASICVLTYPSAYNEVEEICEKSLIFVPHPRYSKGAPAKGRSDCRIKKIVPTPGNTWKDRAMKTVKSKSEYRLDRRLYR